MGVLRSQTTTNRFGFRGPEIFPIDNQIGQLHAGDIDGDGKLDLVLVNNARAKINLLINRTGNTNVEPVKTKFIARTGIPQYLSIVAVGLTLILTIITVSK